VNDTWMMRQTRQDQGGCRSHQKIT